jgi:heat shock protein HspQ
MSLDFQTVQQCSIEGILKQAIAVTEQFQTSPLHYQRAYSDEYEKEIAEWLEKLKPHGIEATSVLDALARYDELKESWKAEEMRERADIEARFYDFLVAQEKQEVSAYLHGENLTGKVESDYTLQQRAELRRIQNRWDHLKEKGLNY